MIPDTVTMILSDDKRGVNGDIKFWSSYSQVPFTQEAVAEISPVLYNIITSGSELIV